eukprot:TRINITY_DN7031_c0_g1_i1.p1 TRINITY_DN7031_c0_g1~~TRINITY_DN7031_c0_g1_i1.p1  ORF type:complete len:660 (+),score=125.60 TRINITY_DN7031_c0_g1_i1:22-1980(+)
MTAVCLAAWCAAALQLLLLLLLASAEAAKPTVLVVVPHPDDEIICCSGVIYNAVHTHGFNVIVVVTTNGDFYEEGKPRGYMREAESVAGLAQLGVPEENVIFLGYPDNYLSELRASYDGRKAGYLVTKHGISETYGDRGRYGKDFHSGVKGEPAKYTYQSLVDDVTEILRTFSPIHVFVPGTPVDLHPDHKALLLTTLEALKAATLLDASFTTTLHITFVWNNEPTWPNAINPFEIFSRPTYDDLSFLPWSRHEALPVPACMRTSNWTENPKYLAIAAHPSQQGVKCSFLLRFLHADEVFWPVVVSRDSASPGTHHNCTHSWNCLQQQPPPPVVTMEPYQEACEGSDVTLHGTVLFARSARERKFAWQQVEGPPVTLVHTDSATPYFVVPHTGEAQLLSFTLIASDGVVSSFPAITTVRVLRESPTRYSPNVAPLAWATASSETPSSRSLATCAIDGVADGFIRRYPSMVGDPTKEWRTDYEGVGAWLQLEWPQPHFIGKLVVYDRPLCDAHVLSALVLFDGGASGNTSIGALDNLGSPYVHEFAPRWARTLRFIVTAVSPPTPSNAVGLAELCVHEVLSLGGPCGENKGADADARVQVDADEYERKGAPRLSYALVASVCVCLLGAARCVWLRAKRRHRPPQPLRRIKVSY